MDPNWKKAQEKVKKVLKAFEAGRKDFWFKEFTDTYQAQGTIVQEQPSDMWYLFEGQFGLIEIKTNQQKLFPFKDIRPSQIAGATRCLAAGGRSTFLICKLPEWKWHYVDGQDLLDARRRGDRSMPWSAMIPIKLNVEEFL